MNKAKMIKIIALSASAVIAAAGTTFWFIRRG